MKNEEMENVRTFTISNGSIRPMCKRNGFGFKNNNVQTHYEIDDIIVAMTKPVVQLWATAASMSVVFSSSERVFVHTDVEPGDFIINMDQALMYRGERDTSGWFPLFSRTGLRKSKQGDRDSFTFMPVWHSSGKQVGMQIVLPSKCNFSLNFSCCRYVKVDKVFQHKSIST